MKSELNFDFDYTAGLSEREVAFSVEIAMRKRALRFDVAEERPPEVSQEEEDAISKAFLEAKEKKRMELGRA